MKEMMTKSKIIKSLQDDICVLKRQCMNLNLFYNGIERELKNVKKEKEDLLKQYNALRKKHERLVWSLKNAKDK